MADTLSKAAARALTSLTNPRLIRTPNALLEADRFPKTTFGTLQIRVLPY